MMPNGTVQKLAIISMVRKNKEAIIDGE